ncbi:hypothetical protein L5515_014435 [Caenorhabditis briggsae]|uniref:Uncharacterized protein n=1 Tax=Caenorhabditis briggsae TaxID=6238 RepID=A0AAE9EDC5_CAEBR|nr:hypothetical protein L5515_014435 [Caenorhabditis briggsae]
MASRIQQLPKRHGWLLMQFIGRIRIEMTKVAAGGTANRLELLGFRDAPIARTASKAKLAELKIKYNGRFRMQRDKGVGVVCQNFVNLIYFL